ncbi:MAG: hypothetical protein ACLFWZ_16505, partial [Coleofasciculus sp.]
MGASRFGQSITLSNVIARVSAPLILIRKGDELTVDCRVLDRDFITGAEVQFGSVILCGIDMDTVKAFLSYIIMKSCIIMNSTIPDICSQKD